MALTLKWWTDLKKEDAYKVNGTVAPESDFEKKLKAYEDLRTKAIGPPSPQSRRTGPGRRGSGAGRFGEFA